MENENRKLRLIQVAKEFKVGLNTVTDFLHKKGVAIDGSPNTQISGDIYAMVEKEFGANRTSTSARDSVREKISTKQATISIEEPKEEPKRTIEVKDEVVQPKILGKIDLSPKKKVEEPKAEEEAAPEPRRRGRPRKVVEGDATETTAPRRRTKKKDENQELFPFYEQSLF